MILNLNHMRGIISRDAQRKNYKTETHNVVTLYTLGNILIYILIHIRVCSRFNELTSPHKKQRKKNCASSIQLIWRGGLMACSAVWAGVSCSQTCRYPWDPAGWPYAMWQVPPGSAPKSGLPESERESRGHHHHPRCRDNDHRQAPLPERAMTNARGQQQSSWLWPRWNLWTGDPGHTPASSQWWSYRKGTVALESPLLWKSNLCSSTPYSPLWLLEASQNFVPIRDVSWSQTQIQLLSELIAGVLVALRWKLWVSKCVDLIFEWSDQV